MSATLTITVQPGGQVPGVGKGNAIPVEGVSFHNPNKKNDKETAQDMVVTVKDGPWVPILYQAAADGSRLTGGLDTGGDSKRSLSVKFTNAYISQFHMGADGYVTFSITGNLEFAIGGQVSQAVGAGAAAAAAEGVRYLKKLIE